MAESNQHSPCLKQEGLSVEEISRYVQEGINLVIRDRNHPLQQSRMPVL